MLLFLCAFPVPSHLRCLITIIMQYIYTHKPEPYAQIHEHIDTHTAVNIKHGDKETNIKHYILPKCCCCSYQLTQAWFTAWGRTDAYKPQMHHTHLQTHTNECVWMWKWSRMNGCWMEGGSKNNEGIIPYYSPTGMRPCVIVCLCVCLWIWRERDRDSVRRRSR